MFINNAASKSLALKENQATDCRTRAKNNIIIRIKPT